VELPVRTVLFQGLPKAEKMDWIVQKTVELGVTEIVPVSMERSIVRLDAQKADKKTARWQTIAEAAARQSRRAIVPQVHAPMTMREAVAYAGSCDVRILPYELASRIRARHQRNSSDGLRPGASLAVFIGPEGGFEASGRGRGSQSRRRGAGHARPPDSAHGIGGHGRAVLADLRNRDRLKT
jgi:16S rRNA (uracil1498-N3)-methyltransferase